MTLSKIHFLLLSIILFSACALDPDKKVLKYDAELSQYQYPFPVKEFHFKSQNQKLVMRYGELGHENSKVAVLLHGKNFSGYYWDTIAKELLQKNYRVIIPDQIGFGKSTKPESYQYSFAQLALNTQKLLDSLDVKSYTVIGHSMGGMLATHLGKLDRNVDKVILINPIGLEDYLKYVEVKDPQFFFGIEKNKTVEKQRAYQRKNYYDGKWNKSFENLLTPYKGWIAGDEWKLVAWNNALTYGPIFSEPIVDILKNTKTKTYLIIGTRDRTGPGRGWKREGVARKLGQYQKLGKTIESSNPKYIELFELEGLGHMPQIEDYERFKKIFLKAL